VRTKVLETRRNEFQKALDRKTGLHIIVKPVRTKDFVPDKSKQVEERKAYQRQKSKK